MKIHDISMEIKQDIMVYNNNENNKPQIVNTDNFDNSNHYESNITMNMHNGTHIDAPLHMIENGKTMASYHIEQFVGKAKVLDLTDIDTCITKEDLIDKEIEEGDLILFKTKNSYDQVFNYEFIYLETSGAEYLKEKKIKGVGTDSLGIERAQPDHSTHKTLLGAGIVIIEGLRLKEIKAGEYQLVVLPIKILETEAAPARAILIEG